MADKDLAMTRGRHARVWSPGGENKRKELPGEQIIYREKKEKEETHLFGWTTAESRIAAVIRGEHVPVTERQNIKRCLLPSTGPSFPINTLY